MRALALGALTLSTLLLVAACTSASPAPVGSGSAAGGGGAPSAVAIQNFSFQPSSITVAKGTTVTWTNRDSVNHTVTADGGTFASGHLAQGSAFTHTFTEAGTFTYHCSIHPSMTATVVVH